MCLRNVQSSKFSRFSPSGHERIHKSLSMKHACVNLRMRNCVCVFIVNVYYASKIEAKRRAKQLAQEAILNEFSEIS